MDGKINSAPWFDYGLRVIGTGGFSRADATVAVDCLHTFQPPAPLGLLSPRRITSFCSSLRGAGGSNVALPSPPFAGAINGSRRPIENVNSSAAFRRRRGTVTWRPLFARHAASIERWGASNHRDPLLVIELCFRLASIWWWWWRLQRVIGKWGWGIVRRISLKILGLCNVEEKTSKSVGHLGGCTSFLMQVGTLCRCHCLHAKST